MILFIFSLIFVAGRMVQAQTTWEGTISSDWNTGTNLDTGVIPGSCDNVFIPDVSPSPVLSANASTNDLIIKSGAAVTTEGNDFTIDAGPGNVTKSDEEVTGAVGALLKHYFQVQQHMMGESK